MFDSMVTGQHVQRGCQAVGEGHVPVFRAEEGYLGWLCLGCSCSGSTRGAVGERSGEAQGANDQVQGDNSNTPCSRPNHRPWFWQEVRPTYWNTASSRLTDHKASPGSRESPRSFQETWVQDSRWEDALQPPGAEHRLGNSLFPGWS